MSALAGAPTAGESLLRVGAPPFAPTSEFTSTLSPHPLCPEMSMSSSVVIPLPPDPARGSTVWAGTTLALLSSPGVGYQKFWSDVYGWYHESWSDVYGRYHESWSDV